MPSSFVYTVDSFLAERPHALLGQLVAALADEGLPTSRLTALSWQEEIAELHRAFAHIAVTFPPATNWLLLFEYVLPVLGQRIDCVLIAPDVVYVVEYKGGNSASARSALRQAQNYAINLMDFHEESRGRLVIPLAVGNFQGASVPPTSNLFEGAALKPDELSNYLSTTHPLLAGSMPLLNTSSWNTSRYFPVPSLIEAASAIYQNHNIRELAHSRAGIDNLDLTEAAALQVVREAIESHRKVLVVITGVPGAGKTLAGLNIVQRLSKELDSDQEQAAFLSGNSPLVAVLQEALRRSARAGNGTAGRAVGSRVREVHRFVRDTFADVKPPAAKLLVFDEAQRAWTAARNQKKFGRDVAEPDMILDIMDRHPGWAAVVALVGGGQEIHSGEAGLTAWGDAALRHPNWLVVSSPDAVDGGLSLTGGKLFRDSPPPIDRLQINQALHLAVPKRSYESEDSVAWVNAVLSGDATRAANLAFAGLPVYVTRSLPQAKEYLRSHAIGYRRVGLVASSGAARLRAEGIEPPTFHFLQGVDYVKWFLEPDGDFRSSNQLEVALSEFELQGLELDYSCVLWGGDLVFDGTNLVPRKLVGTKWRVVASDPTFVGTADDRPTRIVNKYRVLMTRFRKEMLIYIPPGSETDETRSRDEFDRLADFLRRCGAVKLGRSNSSNDTRTCEFG